MALAICLCVLLGCSSREPPLLLGVTALAPRSLEPGDAVEVTGVGFPIGKPATVTLEGTLSRAGAAASDFSATFPAASSSASQLSFVLDPDLADTLCGKAGARAHATFRGRALVAFAPRISGAPPIVGVLEGLTLEVFPARNADSEARLEESNRLLSFLGVELAPTLSPEGSPIVGVRIGRVLPGSRAERGGLGGDDAIIRANGVTVLGPSDLIPATQQRSLELLVERGDARSEALLHLSVVGFSRVLGEGYTWAAALVLAATFLLLAVAVWPGRFWAELALRFARRSASTPSPELGLRSTPMGLQGGPRRTPSRLHVGGLTLSVAVCFTWVTLHSPRLGESGGVWVCLLLLVVLRLLSTFVTSGLDPRHGFKFFRAARSTLALLSLEICGLCAVVPLTLSSSALRLESAAGSGAPWQWPALQSPFGFLLLVVFLAPTVIDATSSRSTAELHSLHRIAPSRALVLCDWALILFKCEVAAGIFLGGAMPFGTSLGTGSLAFGIAAHQLKYLILVLLLAKLRAVLDFPRAEEIALPYLRWLSLPLLLFAGASLISIEAERFALLRWICAASGYGLCLALVVGSALLAIATRRAAASAASSVNPWL